MIGFLHGKILEVSMDSVILNCNGVGYEVHVPTHSLAAWVNAENVEDKATHSLWIYTHVREDALVLFGFETKTEKEFFLQLLKVNGIGPKMALNILSGADFDLIVNMIETEDVKGLSKLPKVGKKTAEQMILTLKGKLVLAPSARTAPAGANSTIAKNDMQRELTSALVHLGFRNQDVDRVVADIPKNIDLQDGLKQALAALTSI